MGAELAALIVLLFACLLACLVLLFALYRHGMYILFVLSVLFSVHIHTLLFFPPSPSPSCDPLPPYFS